MSNNILVNIDDDPVKAVKLGAELYSQGDIFVYPTDTIYGVGGNPFNKTTVDKINKLKSRTEKKQFIVPQFPVLVFIHTMNKVSSLVLIILTANLVEFMVIGNAQQKHLIVGISLNRLR